MEKALEKLAKMNLSDENQKKLAALLTEGKKSGKVSSKRLIETLDAIDSSEEQTEQVYDLLEQSGVEIDVGDVLEILAPPAAVDLENLEDLPTEQDLQQLEELPLADPAEAPEVFIPDPAAKLDDAVRMTLSGCTSRRSAKSPC